MKPLYREFTTQAQIDAQYNAAASVPDAAAYFRGFAERSADARAGLPCVLDVPYGPTRAETLDIFPAAQAGAPVFVFLHGGYWRAFSSKDFSAVAFGLHPLGITTVVVDYALAPRVGLDEIARQARAALAWVLAHIARHGGDAARVAVGGHSAGAQLSAMALATDWVEDYGLPTPDPLAAALLVSGLYDIEPLRWSYLQPSIQLDDGVIRRNSPLHRVRSCATPVFVTWGGDESAEFARQSQAFHAAWQAAGNHAGLEAQPRGNHFSAVQALEDPASAACAWLAARLNA